MGGLQVLLLFTFAVGIAQGLLLCVVLVRLEGPHRRAMQILAGLVLCFSLMIGEEFLDAANLASAFPHVMASTATLDLVIAPLLLLYARCLTDPERALRPRDGVHLVPFVIATLLLAPYYLLSGPEKLSYFAQGLPPSMAVILLAKIVVMAAYLLATIRHLRRFVRTTDRARCPRNQYLNVVWYLRAVIALAGVGAGSLVLFGMLSAGVDVPIDSDYFGTMGLCAGTYLLSFLMMRYPMAGTTAAPALGWKRRAGSPATRTKYETSPLSAVQKQAYLDRLLRHVERQRPFLDMHLNLPRLSRGAGISPTYVSQILNELLHVNFYEFVNGYRVRHAKTLIAGPGGSQKTLLVLAHESGFNSKASFNRAFKRVTGLTPSQYATSTRLFQKRTLRELHSIE